MTARENLDAFGSLHGLAGARLAQADRLGARAHRASRDRAAEPIKQFSGGMRRRLNIACGILHRPRIVLLDEPTVGVDPQSRDRIYDVLAELRATGVSLLAHHASPRGSRSALLAHGDHRPRQGHRVGNAAGAGRPDRRTAPPRDAAARCAAARRWRDARGAAASTSTPADPRTLRATHARRRDRAAAAARPHPSAPAAPSRTSTSAGPSLQAVFIHLTGRELRE